MNFPNMNQIYQEKINKIITTLDTLFAKLPTTTTQQQQEQATLADLVNKLKSEELKEVEALGKLGDTHLTEKGEWLSQKASLEQTIREKDQALTSEKKKLSEELVKKLEDLSKSEGTDPTKLQELKTLLETVKSNSEKKTETEAKVNTEELAKELAKQPKETNYWGIGATVLAGIAVIITAIILFKQNERE